MTRNNVLDYEFLVQQALRQVVKNVLSEVAKSKFDNTNHHFYITFTTDHPSVEMPSYLKDEYPYEMVIVIQHEFWDLEVKNDRFSVVLSFDDIKEKLTIPFSAIVSFVDPSVKFGLQFVSTVEDETLETDNLSDKDSKNSAEDKTNVVSLDDFRKK